MVNIVFGEDTYRKNKYIKEISDDFIKKNKNGNIITVSFENLNNVQEFNNLIKSTSLFGEKRLIIVKNIENLDDIKLIKESLKSIIENKQENLLIEFSKKPTKEFDFLIKGSDKKQDFSPLNPKEFELFLEEESKTRGFKIKKEDVKKISQELSGNTNEAILALEMISLGQKSESKITIPDFFPLIQKLKNGKTTSEKMIALEYLLINEDSVKIFNMLSSISGPKTKPVMADYDIAIKSGKLEYDEAILYYCLS